MPRRDVDGRSLKPGPALRVNLRGQRSARGSDIHPGPTIRRFAAGDFGLRGTLAVVASRIFGTFYYGLRLLGRVLTGRRPVLVRKILVARSGKLGDLILFLPALRGIRERYPDAKITLGIRPGVPAAFFPELEDVVDGIRILDLRAAGSVKEQLRRLVSLVVEGYDLVFSGAAYALVPEAFCTGAPFFVGLWDGHPLQRFNTRLIPVDPSRHEADNNLRLADPAAREPGRLDGTPNLSRASAVSVEKAGDVRSRFEIPAEATVVGVHVGGWRPSRRWPSRSFVALSQGLLERRSDVWIVYTGVESEEDLVDSVRERLEPVLRSRTVSVAGRTSLHDVLALMREASVFVSNDTGVMHLARSSGTPLVAILGPENPERWGPYPRGSAPAVTLRNAVPCAPCKRRSCDLHVCLRSLGPDRVLRETLALLEAGRDPSSAGEAPLHPVEVTRREQALSWRELSDRGFALPPIGVVLLPDDRLVRQQPGSRGLHREEILGILESLRSAAEHYPALRVAVALPPGRSLPRQPRSDGPEVVAVAVDVRRPGQTWKDLLAAVDTPFVVPLWPGMTWEPAQIAALASVLIREPDVAVVHGRRVSGSNGASPRKEVALMMLRRSALESQLSRRGANTNGKRPGGDLLVWPDLETVRIG